MCRPFYFFLCIVCLAAQIRGQVGVNMFDALMINHHIDDRSTGGEHISLIDWNIDMNALVNVSPFSDIPNMKSYVDMIFNKNKDTKKKKHTQNVNRGSSILTLKSWREKSKSNNPIIDANDNSFKKQKPHFSSNVCTTTSWRERRHERKLHVNSKKDWNKVETKQLYTRNAYENLFKDLLFKNKTKYHIQNLYSGNDSNNNKLGWRARLKEKKMKQKAKKNFLKYL